MSILCPCPWLYLEADNLSGFTVVEGFYLRVNQTLSLTHAWLRWYLHDILAKILQRKRTSRGECMCVCACVCAHTHTYMYINVGRQAPRSGVSKLQIQERKWFSSTSPKAGRLETQEGLMLLLQSVGRKILRSQLKDSQAGGLFVLFRPSTDETHTHQGQQSALLNFPFKC